MALNAKMLHQPPKRIRLLDAVKHNFLSLPRFEQLLLERRGLLNAIHHNLRCRRLALMTTQDGLSKLSCHLYTTYAYLVGEIQKA